MELEDSHELELELDSQGTELELLELLLQLLLDESW